MGVATRELGAARSVWLRGSLELGLEAVWYSAMGAATRQSGTVRWVWLGGSLDGCGWEAVWCSDVRWQEGDVDKARLCGGGDRGG